jgi:hypothetical protein
MNKVITFGNGTDEITIDFSKFSLNERVGNSGKISIMYGELEYVSFRLEDSKLKPDKLVFAEYVTTQAEEGKPLWVVPIPSGIYRGPYLGGDLHSNAKQVLDSSVKKLFENLFKDITEYLYMLGYSFLSVEGASSKLSYVVIKKCTDRFDGATDDVAYGGTDKGYAFSVKGDDSYNTVEISVFMGKELLEVYRKENNQELEKTFDRITELEEQAKRDLETYKNTTAKIENLKASTSFK